MSAPAQSSILQETLVRLLGDVPFFRTLDRVDIARLVGVCEAQDIPAGALIVVEGDVADGLYLLARGQVAVTVKAAAGEQVLATLQAPTFFGELGILLARRTASVRALTDAQVWKLPRERFEQLARERTDIALGVAASATELLERGQRRLVGAPAMTPRDSLPIVVARRVHRRPLVWRIAGFALAVGVPLLLWPLSPPGGLSPQGWHVSVIVLGAAIGWLLEPLPDFVIALLMTAAWGVAGLASVPLAFAGFASSAWVLALASFTLALTMARSGLLFRLALFLLQTFPATHLGLVLALLLSGTLITPLVPSPLARVAAVVPLTQEMAQTLNYRRRSRASAGIGFAGLLGSVSFGSVFLTGLVINFFVLGLLPPGDRLRFDWLAWLMSAMPATLITFVGAVVVLLVLFRPEATPKLTPEVLRRQERALGALSPREGVAIAAAVLFLLGLILQPLFRIDPAWPAVGAFGVAVAGGALDRERFRSGIDWGFLILFGILLGMEGVLHRAGVDRWIGDSLLPLVRSVSDPAALVMLLALFVVACRLVLPLIPAALLLTLAFVPAAGRLGLSPWVVGFVILFAANTWLHPSQSNFYRLMRDATRGEMFTDRQGTVLGVAITLVMLVAVAVCIPYWRATGLLP